MENQGYPNEDEPVSEENVTPEPSAPMQVLSEVEQIEEIKLETSTLKSKACESNHITECKEIQVKVSEPQIIGGGIFSKKYVVYTVTTDPLDWVVKRRYSDFLWLREVLITLNICSYLPPLPPKKAAGNLEGKIMQKRQQFLNQFMVVLIKDPSMRGSNHVLNFLKETDEKKFKKYKNSSKAKKPETVYQTINLDGIAHVEYSDCSKIYDPQMNYINQTEALKKKIKQKCSMLMDDEKRLSENLKKYADIVKELEECQKKIPDNEQKAEVLDLLKNSLEDWSKHEADNVAAIDQDMRVPFSYSRKEMLVLKEIIKEKEGLYANYRKIEAKQKPDKPRDGLDRAKELYGYANYKTQREIERVIRDETELAFSHFLASSQRQAERAKKFHMIWSELMEKLSHVKFDIDSSEA